MSNRICLAALWGVVGLGCVRIDGGAVEISWVISTGDGRAITDCTCTKPAIASVQLNLVGVGDFTNNRPCDGRSECRFPCGRQTGATPFEIDPGRPGPDGKAPQYQISVTALGVDGLPADGVISPAPILRSVVKGQPTEVEAFLLVSECSQDCSGINSSSVCTRP